MENCDIKKGHVGVVKFNANTYLDKLLNKSNKTQVYSKVINLTGDKKDKVISLIKNNYSGLSIEGLTNYIDESMPNRIKAVVSNQPILHILLKEPITKENFKRLQRYRNVDLSISIYTMKTILNLFFGFSTFSGDIDYEIFSKYESHPKVRWCYYNWENIWWDTDTGRLSKEEINHINSNSEAAGLHKSYHLNANKMNTILRVYKQILDGKFDKEHVPIKYANEGWF